MENLIERATAHVEVFTRTTTRCEPSSETLNDEENQDLDRLQFDTEDIRNLQ